MSGGTSSLLDSASVDLSLHDFVEVGFHAVFGAELLIKFAFDDPNRKLLGGKGVENRPHLEIVRAAFVVFVEGLVHLSVYAQFSTSASSRAQKTLDSLLLRVLVPPTMKAIDSSLIAYPDIGSLASVRGGVVLAGNPTYTVYIRKEVRTMKRLVKENERVFGMTNLVPRRTGLSCYIWADGTGESRNVPHSIPRVELKKDNYRISVSIEPNPIALAAPSDIPHNVMESFKEAMKYVGRNWDLFLKHYNSENDSYDDTDLTDDLRSRGEFH